MKSLAERETVRKTEEEKAVAVVRMVMELVAQLEPALAC